MLVEVPRERDLVNLRLLLEVFRENDLINGGPILRFALQTLFDDHVEVFGDALRDWIILLTLNLLLKLLNIVRVIGIFVRAHFV